MLSSKTMVTMLRRGAKAAPFLLILVLVCLVLPASANGGIAISGSFYRQDFCLPQGSQIANPSIYVIVFNNEDEELYFELTYQAPPGVEVLFSVQRFPLQPGEQKQVYLTVKVAEIAVPGDYELLVSAQASRGQAGGTTVAVAAAQRAELTIWGESAWVSATALTPEGKPMEATLRLFHLRDGTRWEIAFSQTGSLEAKVVPGRYSVVAYISGEKRGEEWFDIAADEEKSITLTPSTVYITGLSIVPSLYVESGELASAKLVYTIKNLYQPLKEIEVILKIACNGETVEEIPLLSLPTLDVGSTSGSYNYAPQKWLGGDYSFSIQLYTQGKLYAQDETQLVVALTSVGTPYAASRFTINISDKIGEDGKTLEKVLVTSPDEKAWIEIEPATAALTADGKPLREVETEVVAELPPLPQNTIPIGPAYRFGPEGANFEPPLKLTLSYALQHIPPSVAEKELVLASYDAEQGWWKLETELDSQNHLASARVSHFSYFALIAPISTPKEVNLALIGEIIAGVVIISSLGYYLFRRRQR